MEKKYNYLYQIKNNINGKLYIGVHSTDEMNDGYMGRGKNIMLAIKEFGKDNFTKTIIKFFETSYEAYEEERKIVNKEWIKRKDTYNISCGGSGRIK